jgi:hypothetical protein
MDYINHIKDYFYNLFYKEEEIEYQYQYTNRKKYSPVKKKTVISFKNNIKDVKKQETDAKILDLQFRLIELSRNNYSTNKDDDYNDDYKDDYNDNNNDDNNNLKESKIKKLIKN